MRRTMRLSGHRNTLSHGPAKGPRQPPIDGWKTTCVCGWVGGPFRIKREAEAAYLEHMKTSAPYCQKCKEFKNLAQMSKVRQNLCKKCAGAHVRAWKKLHPREWDRLRRRAHLFKKYGITLEQYENLIEIQGRKCAICQEERLYDSRSFRPHIDHCHKTGIVRGILCGGCNMGLGALKDDPKIVQRALSYLLKYSDKEDAA